MMACQMGLQNCDILFLCVSYVPDFCSPLIAKLLCLGMQDKEDFQSRWSLVKKLLEDHGQSLVVALINACLFCLPTFIILLTTDNRST